MSGAIEIKDKNSSVRLSLNAQGAAFIDTISPIDADVTGTVTVSSIANPVTLVQPVNTVQVANPAILGSYVFSRGEQAGLVAATNHMTLFNPSGSGRTLVLGGVFISSIVLADISVAARSMRGYRITAASAGTLALDSEIAKWQTTMTDPVAEVRTGGVTATLGPALFNSPPVLGAGKTASPFVHQVPVPQALGPFTLVPGEGIVLRTEAGDVDTLWNLSVAWSEI